VNGPRAKRVEWLLLGCILALLAGLRFSLDSGPGPFGVDGGYYVQIARNLYEGRGLTTSVDLYHQGLDPLPAPTNIYPLWPALLAGYARLAGMEHAVHDLSRVLYLVSLLALYSIARRVAPEVQRIHGGFTVAHLAVLLFGLTPVFFTSTTFPYTEGLAFAVACAALATTFRPGPLAAFIGGVLGALATLTRSQMLMLAFALVAVRALAALREKRWKELFLSAAGLAAVLVPWLLYVRTFAGSFAISHLWVSYSQPNGIRPYQLGVATGSISESLAVKAQGLVTSFNPWSPHSFVALFGAVALLVPIAALHWLRRVVREKPAISSGVLALAASGAMLTGVLLLTPQRYFRPWLFGWRHGLPLIFLLILALVELIGFGHRVVRIGALAIATISVLWGGATTVRTVAAGPPPGLTPAERQLVAWLDRQPPSTVVLTTNAQSLAPFTRVNLRWAACDDSPETIRDLFSKVRTDYAAIYEREQGCRFSEALRQVARPVGVLGAAPQRILLVRRR
jgi:hypothetical protein